MIPLQEIDIHTDKKVFYKVHLVAPTGTVPFFTEVLVYNSELSPPLQSNVAFHQQFNSASDAFTHAINWVIDYCSEHEYTVNRINNPCNCEFLPQTEQQHIVEAAGLLLQVQINGA